VTNSYIYFLLLVPDQKGYVCNFVLIV